MSNIVRFVIYTWEDENGTVPSLSSLSWLQRGVDKLPVCPCARGLTAHRLVPVIHLSAWKSRMSRVANSSRQVDAASKRTWYSRMSDIINRWITGNGWHEDLTGSFYSPLSVRTFYTFIRKILNRKTEFNSWSLNFKWVKFNTVRFPDLGAVKGQSKTPGRIIK